MPRSKRRKGVALGQTKREQSKATRRELQAARAQRQAAIKARLAAEKRAP